MKKIVKDDEIDLSTMTEEEKTALAINCYLVNRGACLAVLHEDETLHTMMEFLGMEKDPFMDLLANTAINSQDLLMKILSEYVEEEVPENGSEESA